MYERGIIVQINHNLAMQQYIKVLIKDTNYYKSKINYDGYKCRLYYTTIDQIYKLWNRTQDETLLLQLIDIHNDENKLWLKDIFDKFQENDKAIYAKLCKQHKLSYSVEIAI